MSQILRTRLSRIATAQGNQRPVKPTRTRRSTPVPRAMAARFRMTRSMSVKNACSIDSEAVKNPFEDIYIIKSGERIRMRKGKQSSVRFVSSLPFETPETANQSTISCYDKYLPKFLSNLIARQTIRDTYSEVQDVLDSLTKGYHFNVYILLLTCILFSSGISLIIYSGERLKHLASIEPLTQRLKDAVGQAIHHLMN